MVKNRYSKCRQQHPSSVAVFRLLEQHLTSEMNETAFNNLLTVMNDTRETLKLRYVECEYYTTPTGRTTDY